MYVKGEKNSELKQITLNSPIFLFILTMILTMYIIIFGPLYGLIIHFTNITPVSLHFFKMNRCK